MTQICVNRTKFEHRRKIFFNHITIEIKRNYSEYSLLVEYLSTNSYYLCSLVLHYLVASSSSSSIVTLVQNQPILCFHSHHLEYKPSSSRYLVLLAVYSARGTVLHRVATTRYQVLKYSSYRRQYYLVL